MQLSTGIFTVQTAFPVLDTPITPDDSWKWFPAFENNRYTADTPLCTCSWYHFSPWYIAVTDGTYSGPSFQPGSSGPAEIRLGSYANQQSIWPSFAFYFHCILEAQSDWKENQGLQAELWKGLPCQIPYSHLEWNLFTDKFNMLSVLSMSLKASAIHNAHAHFRPCLGPWHLLVQK